jgi:hypothetical protein
MPTRKYARPNEELTSKFSEDGFAQKLKSRKPNSLPAFVGSDGKHYARGFVDTNDNLEFFVREDKLYAKFIKSESGGLDQAILDVAEGTLAYEAYKPVEYNLYSNFGSYAYPRRMFDVMGLRRTEYSPGYMREDIAMAGVVGSDNANFVYTGESNLYTGNNGVSSNLWAKTYKRQRWFKPYKVNMFLYPNGLINASDLIILKTGEYGTGQNGKSGIAKEQICWVSAHEVVKENKYIVEPVEYFLSGALRDANGNITGTGIFSYHGATGMTAKTFQTGVAYLSSKNYYYDNDDLVSGGMNWLRQEADQNGIKTGVATQGTTDTDLVDSDFYKYYTDQQHKILTGAHWDGVIPANVPFKFECWQANGKLEGFDGEITLIPDIPEITDSNAKGFSINLVTTGYGESEDSLEEASILALVKANRKKVLAFDKKLVEYGYAHQGRRWKQFINMADTQSKTSKITAGWNINATGVTGVAA